MAGRHHQRIVIARLSLNDAPIFVVDEATSALDLEVKAAIQESLSELMSGKTGCLAEGHGRYFDTVD